MKQTFLTMERRKNMTVLFIGRREFLAQALTKIYNNLEFTVYLNDWEDDFLEQISQNQPALVILEITRPERKAFSACQKIKAAFPDQPILLFSTHYREHYLQKSLEAKATGYLHQDLSMEEINQGFQKVLKGQATFPYPTNPYSSALSPREIEILYLLRSNYTQEKIASSLAISRRTVNNHLAHINDKLNTQSSIAAVLRAIELGIL